MTRAPALITTMAVVTALTGCGADRVSQGTSRDMTTASVPLPPLSGHAADSAHRPDGRGFPPCKAADLRGTIGGYNGLTGGTAIDFVFLRNVSNRSCSLSGTPTVTALDRGGRPVPLRRVELDGLFNDASVSVALISHARNGSWSEAMVPMSVSGLDDTGQPCGTSHVRRFRTILVSIPGSGRVAANVPREGSEAGLGTCDGRFRSGQFLPAT